MSSNLAASWAENVPGRCGVGASSGVTTCTSPIVTDPHDDAAVPVMATPTTTATTGHTYGPRRNHATTSAPTPESQHREPQ